MKTKTIKHKGKDYVVFDSQKLVELIKSDFKKNIGRKMNKYPALSLALSKIPNKCVFASAEAPRKAIVKIIENWFAYPQSNEQGGNLK